MRYLVKRDIVIPAGTELHVAPSLVQHSDMDGNPAIATGNPAHFVEALVPAGRDYTHRWTMHIDDALSAGIIEPIQ